MAAAVNGGKGLMRENFLIGRLILGRQRRRAHLRRSKT